MIGAAIAASSVLTPVAFNQYNNFQREKIKTELWQNRKQLGEEKAAIRFPDSEKGWKKFSDHFGGLSKDDCLLVESSIQSDELYPLDMMIEEAESYNVPVILVPQVKDAHTQWKQEYAALSVEKLKELQQMRDWLCSEHGAETCPGFYLSNFRQPTLTYDLESGDIAIDLMALEKISMRSQFAALRHEMVHDDQQESKGSERLVHAHIHHEMMPFEAEADEQSDRYFPDYAGMIGYYSELLELSDGRDLIDRRKYQSLLDRTKQQITLFAQNESLTTQQREEIYQDIVEVNERYNAVANQKCDLLEFYHEQFSKFHSFTVEEGQESKWQDYVKEREAEVCSPLQK